MAVATKEKPKTETTTTVKTISDVIAESLYLVDELAKYGVQAGIYTRPPDGREIFSIGRGNGIPGTIMIWPGGETTELTIIGDKKRKQAVITAHEPRRTLKYNFTETVNFPYQNGGSYGYDYTEPTQAQIDEKINYVKQRVEARPAQHWRGANLPRTATYKVTGTPKMNVAKNFKTGTVSITISATIPATTQHFLVGFDERAQFISVLPRKVTSVEDAHNALRPKGVPADAVRQGEWFFVPATKKVAKVLDALSEANSELGRPPMIGGSWGGRARRDSGHRLENGSSHEAKTLVNVRDDNNGGLKVETGFRTGRDIYVKGIVRDTRAGKHAAHDFEDWHRVVRNAEVIAQPGSATRPQRRYD